jgi:hypothetical protein
VLASFECRISNVTIPPRNQADTASVVNSPDDEADANDDADDDESNHQSRRGRGMLPPRHVNSTFYFGPFHSIPQRF